MLRALPPVIEPTLWIVAFHKTSPYWWVRALSWGRYKHVSAFAWVSPLGMWVYYDVKLVGTKIMLLPNSDDATAWIVAQTADADLVSMPSRRHRRIRPMIAPFYCGSAIRHLVGVPGGALRLGALHRDCLRHGGELIHGRAREADAEPGAIAPAGAGQG